LTYSWLKDGAKLSENGKFSGVQSSSLTISNVMGSEQGQYSVEIRNLQGGIASEAAFLRVVDPFIRVQPLTQTANPGDTATLEIDATGAIPLYLQWRKDGSVISGATTASLTLTNLQRADAGNYDVLLSNAFGSITSSVVMLTVNLAAADALNVK